MNIFVSNPRVRAVQRKLSLGGQGAVELPPSLTPRPRQLLRPDESAAFTTRAELVTRVQRVLVATDPPDCEWGLERISIGKDNPTSVARKHYFECSVGHLPDLRAASIGEEIRVTLRNLSGQPCRMKPALLIVRAEMTQEPVTSGRIMRMSTPETTEQTVLSMKPLADPWKVEPGLMASITLEARAAGPFRTERLLVESDGSCEVEILEFTVGKASFFGPGGCPIELFTASRTPKLSIPTADYGQWQRVRLVNHSAEPRRVTVQLDGATVEDYAQQP